MAGQSTLKQTRSIYGVSVKIPAYGLVWTCGVGNWEILKGFEQDCP